MIIGDQKMTRTRKTHTADFKAKIALEAIRQQKTLNEITSEYGVHSTQITRWKKQALDALSAAFSCQREQNSEDRQLEIDELHRQLGQAISERDWLKKKSATLL